ncbi:hypothetical protein LXL04_038797 [Taraxacum kok-saghyz]
MGDAPLQVFYQVLTLSSFLKLELGKINPRFMSIFHQDSRKCKALIMNMENVGQILRQTNKLTTYTKKHPLKRTSQAEGELAQFSARYGWRRRQRDAMEQFSELGEELGEGESELLPPALVDMKQRPKNHSRFKQNPGFHQNKPQAKHEQPIKTIYEFMILTSWSDLNPGRRFWSCGKKGSRCRFIGWYDPPMCARAVSIIPGLLRSMNRGQESIKQMQIELRKMKWMLILSWFTDEIGIVGLSRGKTVQFIQTNHLSEICDFRSAIRSTNRRRSSLACFTTTIAASFDAGSSSRLVISNASDQAASYDAASCYFLRRSFFFLRFQIGDQIG